MTETQERDELQKKLDAAGEADTKLRDALDELTERRKKISGCSNHYCIVYDPKGMRTNGPCKCHKDERSMRLLASAFIGFEKKVREALASQPASEGKQ